MILPRWPKQQHAKPEGPVTPDATCKESGKSLRFRNLQNTGETDIRALNAFPWPCTRFRSRAARDRCLSLTDGINVLDPGTGGGPYPKHQILSGSHAEQGFSGGDKTLWPLKLAQHLSYLLH